MSTHKTEEPVHSYNKNIAATPQNGVANQDQTEVGKVLNLETPDAQSTRSFEALGASLNQNQQASQPDGNSGETFPVFFGDSTSEYNCYFQVVKTRKVRLAKQGVEKDLVEFTKTTAAQHLKDKSPEEVLNGALRIYGEYDRQVSFGENVQNGIATIYRIQEGKFLKRLKEIVEKVYGKRKWLEWVEKYIPHKSYRVIRQYIQLAETPNVITYAPLGKEMLVKLIAMLKSNKQLYGKDPIGRFLQSHEITYNPKVDQGPEHAEIMRVIRAAMNYQKLMDAKLADHISRDQVQRLLDQGKTVNEALIKELLTAKDEGKDLADHMETILGNKGRLQGLKSAEEKRFATQTAFDRFSELANEVTGDEQAFEGIRLDQVRDILEKLELLKEKLQADDEEEDQEEEQEEIEVPDVPPVLENPNE